MDDAAQSLIATREGPQGEVGRLLMNRPRALNALDLAMIDGFAAAIAAWRDDASLRLVLLEGAGDRAFCAGGDVRQVRQDVLEGRPEAVAAFFTREYAVNAAIAAFPRPWVSLIDGVCMGGGLGVSVHGSHRIVTEHALLAMPETAIALFPDVGTSHVLPRLPGGPEGGLGRWIALTGARLKGAEAVSAGLATHYVPRERLPALREALLESGDVAVLDRFAEAPGETRIDALRPAIARCFGQPDRAGIEAALEAEGTDWAREQLAILRRVSPTSVAVTLELLRRGAALDLAGCLALELALTQPVTQHPDFAEGVRSVLVDKDQSPKWAETARIGDIFPAG